MTEKTKGLGEKPVPVPLCHTSTLPDSDLGANPGLLAEKPVTNRLSYGPACEVTEKHECHGMLSSQFGITSYSRNVGQGGRVHLEWKCIEET
jgi:hypothetical protein